MAPCIHSDWSKTHLMFDQSIKHGKSMFYCFSPHYLYIIMQMKKPKP